MVWNLTKPEKPGINCYIGRKYLYYYDHDAMPPIKRPAEIVEHIRDNIYKIKTLSTFYYVILDFITMREGGGYLSLDTILDNIKFSASIEWIEE